MARTDLEKQMKEKLGNRTIKPSAEAWASLSNCLENNEEKNNRKFWWLGIAASIVGVLLVVSIFYKQEEVIPIIVNTPNAVKPDNSTKIAVQKDTVKVEEKHMDKVVPTPVLKDIIYTHEEPVVLAQELPEVNEQVKKALRLEDKKVQEVVAKVSDLIHKNQEVTDAEIEALLLEAQRSINAQKIISQSTEVVSADLLLQDVENELDQSFRSKVFEAIKESFGTVKTAIAQRNE